MARKTITLNTEPHVVDIGDVELLLQHEVMGDEFVQPSECLIVDRCCTFSSGPDSERPVRGSHDPPVLQPDFGIPAGVPSPHTPWYRAAPTR